ncbi:hypothetical protein FA95DRAFT_1565754 [Auriscalpium vulgare]|uniref:Uncharacterized protein n=1 Tax=Auriscalpium vulgare TaxID=40419 RepID=A0ACB8RAU5_9AGAM|nr:hypothetical protein FA95DRAFT_1565754 [Auriscalpium vulgare]
MGAAIATSVSSSMVRIPDAGGERCTSAGTSSASRTFREHPYRVTWPAAVRKQAVRTANICPGNTDARRVRNTIMKTSCITRIPRARMPFKAASISRSILPSSDNRPRLPTQCQTPLSYHSHSKYIPVSTSLGVAMATYGGRSARATVSAGC